MDALLFAVTLEVALQQMQVIEGSTKLRMQTQIIWTQHEIHQRDKLLRDRKTVKDVLSSTLMELCERGEWTALQEAAHLLERVSSAPQVTLLQHDQLKISREAIRYKLTTNRDLWSNELCNADKRMAYLRDKLKDDFLNAEIRLSYCESWLFARVESLEMRCQINNAPTPQVEHEERVHSELLKAYELQVKELQESLYYWNSKYDRDIVAITEKLREKKEQLTVVVSRREELQKTYDLHEGEMRGWLTFKRERAARLAREEKQRNAATRLQAWWRGVMVRRALGPYRYLKNVKKSTSKNKKK